MAKVAKDCRFDMRMTAEQRHAIERAAAIKGQTLTQWALENLLISARRDIEEETITRLSTQVFKEFSAALDNPMPDAAVRLFSQKPVWE